ncbi:MAG: MBL fold metallo-hydrolase [Actinomycetia bacterium]|nr:MBL fold metallo-hydrolase [Actinomycetes bacterium]
MSSGDTPSNTLHYRDSRVDVHKIVVGDFENNVFVVRCRESGDAVLIDAANEHERLLELCRMLDVRTVLETHGHWDHIQAIPAVRDAGIEVGVAAQDASMLPSYDYIIEHDTMISVGRLNLRTIHNPGHTPGSMSFLLEEAPILFSGDTLFPGGPGNTSFDGGSFDTIIKSIDELMFSPLAPETMVMPGHGLDTTIGRERPNIQEWVDRGW